jgi:hypothetical protein
MTLVVGRQAVYNKRAKTKDSSKPTKKSGPLCLCSGEKRRRKCAKREREIEEKKKRQQRVKVSKLTHSAVNNISASQV